MSAIQVRKRAVRSRTRAVNRAVTGEPRSEPSTDPIAADAFDRDYWLAHCEGFRVDAEGGAIGFVDAVMEGPHGEPVLAVRAGMLGRRVLAVPGESVAFIVPRAQRIWLRSPVRILGSRGDRAEPDPGEARQAPEVAGSPAGGSVFRRSANRRVS